MMPFSVGDLVDIYDGSFWQWRGEYSVIKLPADERGLYKIRNTKTGSQQFVTEKSLRRGRLPPFCLKSLQP